MAICSNYFTSIKVFLKVIFFLYPEYNQEVEKCAVVFSVGHLLVQRKLNIFPDILQIPYPFIICLQVHKYNNFHTFKMLF